MLFHSISFLFLFFPVFLAFIFLLPKGAPKAAALLAFSYLFYSGTEPFFVLVLILSTLTDYVAALGLHRAQTNLRRRSWLLASIVVNMSILIFFKYSQWVLSNLNLLLAGTGIGPIEFNFYHNYVLPAGISFYTFQSMSYTIDVYRRKVEPERSLLGFCNYVTYLPQLIAGPIERFNDLSPQIHRLTHIGTSPRITAGMDRLFLGIAQKLLIADSCGLIVERLALANGEVGFTTSWARAGPECHE